MTTCVRVETAMFSFHPMLPRVRVLPPEELAPPPPQPAKTRAATTTASTSVNSLLPTFIYLPYLACSFRDIQTVLYVGESRPDQGSRSRHLPSLIPRSLPPAPGRRPTSCPNESLGDLPCLSPYRG